MANYACGFPQLMPAASAAVGAVGAASGSGDVAAAALLHSCGFPVLSFAPVVLLSTQMIHIHNFTCVLGCCAELHTYQFSAIPIIASIPAPVLTHTQTHSPTCYTVIAIHWAEHIIVARNCWIYIQFSEFIISVSVRSGLWKTFPFDSPLGMFAQERQLYHSSAW